MSTAPTLTVAVGYEARDPQPPGLDDREIFARTEHQILSRRLHQVALAVGQQDALGPDRAFSTSHPGPLTRYAVAKRPMVRLGCTSPRSSAKIW